MWREREREKKSNAVNGFIRHTQLIHATQIMNWWSHIDDDFSLHLTAAYVPLQCNMSVVWCDTQRASHRFADSVRFLFIVHPFMWITINRFYWMWFVVLFFLMYKQFHEQKKYTNEKTSKKCTCKCKKEPWKKLKKPNSIWHWFWKFQRKKNIFLNFWSEIGLLVVLWKIYFFFPSSCKFRNKEN